MTAHPWPAECRRVIFFSPQLPEEGGGGTFARELSQAIRSAGVEVQYWSIRPGTGTSNFPTRVMFQRPDLQTRPASLGAVGVAGKVASLPRWALKRWDRWITHRQLRRSMSRLAEETLVIFVDARAKILLDDAGYRRTEHSPLLVGMHHSNFSRLRADLKPVVHRAYSDLDAFVALSQEDARSMQEAIGTPGFHVPNPAPQIALPTIARRRLAIALVRLAEEKQLGRMITAFDEVTSLPELCGWELEIYGSGPEEGRLREAIARTRAPHRIRLMGRTDQIPSVLAAAQINLLSSEIEGLPMAILEAASAGVPTLTYDLSPAIHDLLADGAGFLVEPDDERAYVAELAGALGNPDELKRRGRLARTRAEAMSPDAVLGQWAQVIQACYDARRRG